MAKGGNRGGGRPPLPSTIAARMLREKKQNDAITSWDYLVRVRDDESQPASLRVDIAKYLINQIIGTPRQSMDVEAETRVLVVGGGTWTPG